jgi:hypothetical protein
MDNYTGIPRDSAKLMVGKGWAKLIDRIYDRLPKDILIMDVKEKWGGLRVYTDSCNDELLDFLDAIEDESFTVCESCGQPGKRRAGGWIKTLCDRCEAIER